MSTLFRKRKSLLRLLPARKTSSSPSHLPRKPSSPFCAPSFPLPLSQHPRSSNHASLHFNHRTHLHQLLFLPTATALLPSRSIYVHRKESRTFGSFRLLRLPFPSATRHLPYSRSLTSLVYFELTANRRSYPLPSCLLPHPFSQA